MKLRAKIILTAASLALSCALLAGCGSSSGSTASSAASSEPASTVLSQASSIPLGEDNSTDALNAPFETLLDANPISNQFEIAAMNIEYDFNLPAEDVVSYKGVKSNVSLVDVLWLFSLISTVCRSCSTSQNCCMFCNLLNHFS